MFVFVGLVFVWCWCSGYLGFFGMVVIVLMFLVLKCLENVIYVWIDLFSLFVYVGWMNIVLVLLGFSVWVIVWNCWCLCFWCWFDVMVVVLVVVGIVGGVM